MKDITQDFGTLYHPLSALVFYQTKGSNRTTYVEHFDIDKNGNPINAHPLTEREAKELAKALHTKKEKSKAFLKSNGILPTNVLHINPSENGTVLWYTKARKAKMYFTESLEIPNGKAKVPAMLWYASKHSLIVFALEKDRRPTENTVLFHAPFFNVYEDGVQNSDGKVDVRFSNFDVPVLFGVRIAKFFRINVGPMASLRLTNNGKIGDSFDVITGGNSGAEFKNRVAYGYQAGVGLDLGRLSLDVRYEGNFTDIVKVDFDNTTTASQFGKKSNLFQATLGFAIF